MYEAKVDFTDYNCLILVVERLIGHELLNSSSQESRTTKFNGLQVFAELEFQSFADFSWFVSFWHHGNEWVVGHSMLASVVGEMGGETNPWGTFLTH